MKKLGLKLHTFLLTLAILAGGFPVFAIPGAAGSGTASDPWVIMNATQLDQVRNHLNGHFRLGANINLGVPPFNQGEGWVPIGEVGNSPSSGFLGTFDGNGFVVHNLFINRPTSPWNRPQGLFGNVGRTGEITNLGVTISANGIRGVDNIGGIAGVNYGAVSNSFVAAATSTSFVRGSSGVGGLVGELCGSGPGSVNNVYASVDVMGGTMAGGLIGNSSSIITRGYSTGTVTGTTEVGALAGRNAAGVENSHALQGDNLSFVGGGTVTNSAFRTVDEMRLQNTYGASWDFNDVWNIGNSGVNNGFPFLRIFYDRGNLPCAHFWGALQNINTPATCVAPGFDGTANVCEICGDLGNKNGAEVSQLTLTSITRPTLVTSSFAFTGTSHTVALNTSNPAFEIVLGSSAISATNTNDYSVVVRLINPMTNNQTTEPCIQWDNGTTGNITLTWTITRRAIPVPDAQTFVFNETSRSFAVAPGAGFTVTGGTASATNAGTYTVQVTPDANHQWDSGDNRTQARTVSWTIYPRQITVANVNLTPVPATGTVRGTTASIVNPTAPVSSVTSISDVTWRIGANPATSGSGNQFLGSTAYTALVTLTADANHTFINDATFTQSQIAGTNATRASPTTTTNNNAGNQITLSRTFDQTAAPTVTGITIHTQPTNLTYTHGNSLNLTGLVARLTHNDGSTRDVALADFGANQITTSPTNGTSLVRTTHNGEPVAVIFNNSTTIKANTNTLTVNRANQTISINPTSIPTPITFQSTSFTLTTTSGNGTGAVTWAVTAGTAVSVNSTNGEFTISSAGEATVTATKAECDNYNAATATATITITAWTITGNTSLSVSLPAGPFVYNAEEHKPLPTVTLGGATLVRDTDYEVSWSDNVDVGTATATITFKGNYSGTASATFTITPRQITITPNAGQSKVFGAGDPTFTYAHNPALIGATFSGALGRVAGENVGNYAFSMGTLSAGTNHELVLASLANTFEITRPTLDHDQVRALLSSTLTAATFDGTPKSVSVTAASGVVGLGVITVRYSGSTTAPTNAGTYAITVDIATGTNYNAVVGLVIGNFTINQRPIRITGGTSASKVFDGATAATIESVTFDAIYGVPLSGLVGTYSLVLGADYTITNAHFDNANVGTGKGVTATVALSTAATSPLRNYTLANGNLSITTGVITARPITIASVAQLTKIFDGTSSATAGAVTFTGVVGTLVAGTDYTVSAEFTGGNYNVGENKHYTYTVTMLNTQAATNHSLVLNTSSGINGIINPRPITAAVLGAIVAPSIGGTVTNTVDVTTVTPANTLEQATGLTVTWAPALVGGVFAQNTEYTATVTLTANSNHVFTSGDFTSALIGSVAPDGKTFSTTANLENAGNAVTLSLEFDRTLTYEIELTPTSLDFGALSFGYTQPVAENITITNTGTGVTGALSVRLIGTGASSFTLSSTSVSNIAVGGTSSFTVVPNHGLAVNTYTATVEVFRTFGSTEVVLSGFEVKFVVGLAPQSAPTGLTGVPADCGVSDGKITGVTDVMEYRLSTVATWTSVATDATEITGLAAGTYEVRFKETATHAAGALATVTVAQLYCVTVTVAPLQNPPAVPFTGGTASATPDRGVSDTEITLSHTAATGFEFDDWTVVSGGVTIGADNKFTMPANAVEVRANFKAIEYTISYDLINGSVGSPANPETYTIETADFTLTNPTRAGFQFVGWSGTDITDLSLSVTVYQGSHGNRSYTANWVGISLEDAEEDSILVSHDFGSVEHGYSAQTALEVNVINLGNQVTGALSVRLIGTGASSFTLSSTSVSNIAVGGTSSFTVVPNHGLAVNTYTATVEVFRTFGSTEVVLSGFEVKFVVGLADPTTDPNWSDPRIDLRYENVRNVVYGAVLDNAAFLAANSDSRWTWVNPGTFIGDVGAVNTHAARFTPTDPVNFAEKIIYITIDVSQRRLTITAPTQTVAGVLPTKVYDGDRTHSGGGIILGNFTNIVSPDGTNPDNVTLHLSEITFTYDDENVVGATKIIIAYAITGSRASNYSPPVNGEITAEITPASIIISGFNIIKPFDDTDVVLGFGDLIFSGLVNGETATFNLPTATYEFTTVGIHDITFGGLFTMTTDGTAIPSNYTIAQPIGIRGEITQSFTPGDGIHYTKTELNANGWINTDFVITATTGFELSLTNAATGTWTSTLTRTEETDNGSITFFIRNVATGEISVSVTETYKIDKTLPTATITVGSNDITEAIGTGAFNLLFGAPTTATINAEDNLSLLANSGVAKIEHHISDGTQYTTTQDWNSLSWTAGASVSLPNDWKGFIYARITDVAGNVLIVGSDGIVMYNDPDDWDKTTYPLTAIFGDLLSSVALPSGWAWITPSAFVGNVGMQTHTVGFTPNNSVDAMVFKDLIVTVSQLVITITPGADQYKVLGDAEPAEFTFTHNPALIGADETNFVNYAYLGRESGETIGTYEFTLNNLQSIAGSNYEIVMYANAETFEIKGLDIGDGSIVIASIDDQPFTSLPITPILELSRNGTALVEGLDFTVSFSADNVNVGIVIITINGINGFSGTTTTTFKIVPLDIVITPDAGQEKLFGDDDPTEFTFAHAPILFGADETNFTANARLARVAGETVGTHAFILGNLQVIAGDNYNIVMVAAPATFAINGLDISDASIEIEDIADQVFTGLAITPTVEISRKGLSLEEGVDFSVSFGANVNVGIVSVMITGIGGFSGDTTITFNIVPLEIVITPDVDQSKVLGDADPAVFTFTHAPILRGNGGADETDFATNARLERAIGETVGTYAFTLGNLQATAGNNYAIVMVDNPATFAITGLDIADGSIIVADIADQTFTGLAITPTIELSRNGTALVEGVDFTVAFSPNINVGTVEITITGIGGFSGTTTTSFEIVPFEIVITPDADQSKLFGDEDPIFTFTHSPALVVAADEINFATNARLGRADGETVGIYAFTLGNLQAVAGANYTIVMVNDPETFEIKGLDISDGSIEIADIAAHVFTGLAITPMVEVSRKGLSLVEGVDFAVAFSANINVGTVEITITGIGGFSGDTTITFEILPLQITITPDTDQSKEFGEDDPIFTFTHSPALIGDDVFTGALERVEGEAIGDYEFVLGTLSAGSNYELVLADDAATFEIIDTAPCIHVWGDWSDWDIITPASCDAPGMMTRARVCVHCAIVNESTRLIAQLNGDNCYNLPCIHVWSDWSDWSVIKPATCELPGMMERVRLCTLCSVVNEVVRLIAQLNGNNCYDPSQNRDAREACDGERYGIVLENAVVRDSAIIRVIVPEVSKARIGIFDATGNLLFDSSKKSSKKPVFGDEHYEIKTVWNLSNKSGRMVANGTYLIVVQVRGESGKIHQYSARIGVRR
jgi:uncharacterized repeat protein (TIGR02543 family)